MDIPGATGPTLPLSQVHLEQAGYYSVRVGNSGGSVESRSARLIVHARPINDDFADRISLAGEDVYATGSNLYATWEDSSGEPSGPGVRYNSIWWKWTAPRNGIVVVDLAGSYPSETLDLFSGATVGTLTSINGNFSLNADSTTQVRFTATAGISYGIRVGLAEATGGEVNVHVVMDRPPTITAQPQDQFVAIGETAAFSVSVESLSPPSFQWKYQGVLLAGATNRTLPLQLVRREQVGAYSVVVSNEIGRVESRPAWLGLTSVLTGQVTDAIDGHALSGVVIGVQDKTALTDLAGNYRIAGVHPGGLTADFAADVRSGHAPLTVRFSNLSSLAGVNLHASTNGYTPYINDRITVLPDASVIHSFSMSPILGAGEMRLVLNWGGQPRDLDAHLLTPAIAGTNYHLFYPPGNRGRLTAPPYAALDIDRTNGFGPETISIRKFPSGTFRYFVRRFAGEGEIAGSEATVKIYTEAGEVESVTAPSIGSGAYWHVCDIDGTTQSIHIVNRLADEQPAFPATGNPELREGRGRPAGAPSDPPNYSWSFGDGSGSTEKNPLKTYQNPGLFTVSLTVTDASHTNRIEKLDYISVASLANARPTLNALPNLVVDENAAPTSIELAGITSGATNEFQVLTLTATADQPGLVGPTSIDYSSPNRTGLLSFAPVRNAVGTTVITVAVKDSGGTADGGQDTFARQFTVQVSPLPRVSIADASGQAGTQGTVPLVFNVRLDTPSEKTVLVDYFTEDGSARAGKDYIGISGATADPFSPGGSLRIETSAGSVRLAWALPGDNRLLQVRGALVAGDEWRTVAALPVLAGTEQIITLPTESHRQFYRLIRKNRSWLTFNPGEISKSVTVMLSSGGPQATDRYFQVRLADPVNAVVGRGQAAGTLLKDDSIFHAPTVLVPEGPDRTVECPAVPVFSPPTFVDSQGVILVPTVTTSTNVNGCRKEVSRTWRVVDFNGNSTNRTQRIAVVDTTPPALAQPQGPDSTIEAPAVPTFTAPVFIDACDEALAPSVLTTTNVIGCMKVIARTWIAVDTCGNATKRTQKISILNALPLSIQCPPPLITPNSNPLLGTPVIPGNCGTLTVSNDAPAFFAVGTNLVTWTVTDGMGNVATCSQSVIREFPSAPQISIRGASGSQFMLRISSRPGIRCLIQHSEDLSTWIDLESFDGGEHAIELPAGRPDSAGYFLARELP